LRISQTLGYAPTKTGECRSTLLNLCRILDSQQDPPIHFFIGNLLQALKATSSNASEGTHAAIVAFYLSFPNQMN